MAGDWQRVPDWMDDYSNKLMVEGNARLVRWEHVIPSPQDIDQATGWDFPRSFQARIAKTIRWAKNGATQNDHARHYYIYAQ